MICFAAVSVARLKLFSLLHELQRCEVFSDVYRVCDICRCFKMAFDDMREVHKRRYLLQPIAIEIFSADGRNFLLAFPRKIRNKVFDR
jgi:hypothetical protein